MLLPFVRLVILFLLLLTLTAAVLNVARIHMVILTFLGSGLLVSLSFFESEFNKSKRYYSGEDMPTAPDSAPAATTGVSRASAAKTD
jgi:hypothetical protein